MCTAALTAPVASKIGVAQSDVPSTLSPSLTLNPRSRMVANSRPGESTLVMVNGVSWSKCVHRTIV